MSAYSSNLIIDNSLINKSTRLSRKLGSSGFKTFESIRNDILIFHKSNQLSTNAL